MKDVILVTDMGIDCDDAVALGILCNYEKTGKCKILAIATSTTRLGASSTVKTICNYYDVKTEIGKMKSPILECDSKNVYAFDVMASFDEKDVERDNVTVIRKSLANAKNKVTLIEIGPLSSLCGVLKSEADEFSCLDGKSLLKEKVDQIYVMGGSFAQNFNNQEKQAKAEWNVLQDISSAKFVVENCPCKMNFLPFECGNFVKTKYVESNNPAYVCMKIFANKDGKDEKTFTRSSWDPVTVMLAIENKPHFYQLSKSGIVSVQDDGLTVFTEKRCGKHRIYLNKGDFDLISKYINSII